MLLPVRRLTKGEPTIGKMVAVYAATIFLFICVLLPIGTFVTFVKSSKFYSMKKFFLFIAMLLFAIEASAQSYQEVVYLKNGKVLRGLIIELVPDESLKIQTVDGSIFAYAMTEVVKITKEAPVTYVNSAANQSVGSGLARGYRGFIDVADTFGTDEWASNRSELATVHGYQFNQYFFVGAGVGVHYYYGDEFVEVPIFANLRVDFLKTRITPYFDVRVGYAVLDDTGLYLSPSVGSRFRLGTWGALNAGLGYTAQFLECENVGGITLRIGLEF